MTESVAVLELLKDTIEQEFKDEDIPLEILNNLINSLIEVTAEGVYEDICTINNGKLITTLDRYKHIGRIYRMNGSKSDYCIDTHPERFL